MRQHNRGFTLIEVMIVVVIIAILAAVAIPSYRNHVCKVERNQAKADLLAFAQAMERYYTTNNFSYVDGSDNVPNTVFSNRYSPIDGGAGNARFNLAVVNGDTDKNQFKLQASRNGGNCNDGTFWVDSANQRTWDKDGDGTSDQNSWSE